MADWRVSAERIEVFPHPDEKVERLEVARVGLFPLVVNKANGYKDGDIVVFAPKRTILPEDLRGNFVNATSGESYLKSGTTVKSCRMKGVLSEGVTIPLEYVEAKLRANDESKEFPDLVGKTLEDILEQDISEFLGMKEHVPEIVGKVVFGGNLNKIMAPLYSRHDCEGIHIFAGEFVGHTYTGEDDGILEDGSLYVTVAEKIHGSQINVICHNDGFVELSSKGMIGKGATLVRAENNVYWTAWDNSGLSEIVAQNFYGKQVQLIGEVVPVQKGFGYGYTKPDIILFRVEIDGRRYSTWEVMNLDELEPLRKHWTPVLYEGPFDLEKIKAVCKGMETVSGKSLHIKEGGVVESKYARNSRKGHFPLYIKCINPKYKGEEDDDAMS